MIKRTELKQKWRRPYSTAASVALCVAPINGRNSSYDFFGVGTGTPAIFTLTAPR
jgi:hypothetical protein